MASSSMAGAGAADYSGAHSKRTLNTTQVWMPGGGQVDTAPTGSRRGKKTRSTPLGYRTTNTFGNGNLRHGDFAGMSEVATAPYTFAPAMDSCVQAPQRKDAVPPSSVRPRQRDRLA